jgi:hypothetical protein
MSYVVEMLQKSSAKIYVFQYNQCISPSGRARDRSLSEIKDRD